MQIIFKNNTVVGSYGDEIVNLVDMYPWSEGYEIYVVSGDIELFEEVPTLTPKKNTIATHSIIPNRQLSKEEILSQVDWDESDKLFGEVLFEMYASYSDARLRPKGYTILREYASVSPKSREVVDWETSLYVDYEMRKSQIGSDTVISLDFSNNGNIPHSFKECYDEFIALSK